MDEEPTPIELSRAATGYRYYKCDPATYSQLAAGVDQARGYPLGQPSKAVTLKGLPPVEHLAVASDASGRVLIAIDCWRFTEGDDAMMLPAINAGLIEELTNEDYTALLPTPQP